MVNKIILIRHGQTGKNKKDPDRKIISSGRSQMAKAAEELKPLVRGKSSVIISTDTNRTIESAIILSKILNVPLKIETANLRVENIKTLRRERRKDSLTFSYLAMARKKQLPKGIPQPEEVVERFMAVIAKFSEMKTVIIVGHAGALETFALFGKTFRPTRKVEKELDYGEMIILL